MADHESKPGGTAEIFSMRELVVAPPDSEDHAPVSQDHRADVLDFETAARRREARLELKRVVEYDESEQLHVNKAPAAPQNGPTREPVSINAGRYRSLISEPKDSEGNPGPKDHLASYRPQANLLLSRMAGDKAFAKQLLGKDDLGSDYSGQGISESMAAIAYPYVKRALRAAKRSSRFERMDMYVTAASEMANNLGEVMDYQNRRQVVSKAGVHVVDPNTVGISPKTGEPLNFLKRRKLSVRLGISLPALLKFK